MRQGFAQRIRIRIPIGRSVCRGSLDQVRKVQLVSDTLWSLVICAFLIMWKEARDECSCIALKTVLLHCIVSSRSKVLDAINRICWLFLFCQSVIAHTELRLAYSTTSFSIRVRYSAVHWRTLTSVHKVRNTMHKKVRKIKENLPPSRPTVLG